MDWFSPTEIVGYVASALIVLSLAMTSVVRLRLISLVGSLTFVTYGVLIGAVPIILSNAIIAGLNVWFLSREFGPKRELGAVQIAPDAPFLHEFVTTNRADITATQPGFTDVPDDAFVLMLTRKGQPAGLLVGERKKAELHVLLDYVLPAYRDLRLGRWLYDEGADSLRGAAFTRVVATADSSVHETYLGRLGFTPTGGNSYVKDL